MNSGQFIHNFEHNTRKLEKYPKNINQTKHVVSFLIKFVWMNIGCLNIPFYLTNNLWRDIFIPFIRVFLQKGIQRPRPQFELDTPNPFSASITVALHTHPQVVYNICLTYEFKPMTSSILSTGFTKTALCHTR